MIRGVLGNSGLRGYPIGRVLVFWGIYQGPFKNGNYNVKWYRRELIRKWKGHYHCRNSKVYGR